MRIGIGVAVGKMDDVVAVGFVASPPQAANKHRIKIPATAPMSRTRMGMKGDWSMGKDRKAEIGVGLIMG